MIKNADGNISALQKFNIWFGRRAFIFFSISIISNLFLGIVAFMTIASSNKDKTFYQRAIDKMLNYAVVATPDGRIVEVSKKPITTIMKVAVRNALMNYFVLDRLSFVKDDSFIVVSLPENEKINEKIAFLNALIDKSKEIDNLSAFIDEESEESINSFFAYVFYLYKLAKSMYLPDVIRVVGVEKESYIKTGLDSFKYYAEFPIKFSFVTPDGKVHYGKSKISFYVEGRWEPLKASPVNPYGLKIEKLKFRYVDISNLLK